MCTSNGRYRLMLASRSSLPSSTRVMMPAHVIVLETDASMYCVVGSARILRSMLAQPLAIDQTICSPLTTANVAPGVPIARTHSRMNDSRSDALAERRKVNGATQRQLRARHASRSPGGSGHVRVSDRRSRRRVENPTVAPLRHLVQRVAGSEGSWRSRTVDGCVFRMQDAIGPQLRRVLLATGSTYHRRHAAHVHPGAAAAAAGLERTQAVSRADRSRSAPAGRI